jgi:hypothetical protein
MRPGVRATVTAPIAPHPRLDAGLGRERLVEVGVDAGQRGERVVAADLRDEARGVPGRPVREGAPFEDDDVGKAQFREVVGDRRPDDAATHDHHPGAIGRLGDRLQDVGRQVLVGELLRDRHGS